MALDGALEGVTGDGGGLVEAYRLRRKAQWKSGLVPSVCPWKEGSRGTLLDSNRLGETIQEGSDEQGGARLGMEVD